ncbi:MAG: sodium-dependent transporter [Rikenellaceae bacterium]
MEVGNGSRATLGSKLGAILVAAGGAVGLGNIWKFPYVLGESGGAAFLVVYIGCILLLGLPVMLAEMAIGREAKSNVVGAYKFFSPKWKPLGYAQVLISILTMGFYFVVAGWTAEYFFASVTGELAQLSTPAEYEALFDSFRSNAFQPVLFALIFILFTHVIVQLGINKGIENASKFLMPVLFIILVVLSIKSLTMPNSSKGLAFLFNPDFSKITPDVFYKAMGQAFFSLSVGFGALVTYASYFGEKTKMVRTAVSVTVVDTMVAIIAGLMIFPAVFSVGIEPSSGPSLVFITLPAVLNTMAFSSLWSSVFFLLLVIAALTSTISLHEIVTLYFMEEWKLVRGKASIITSVIVGVLAIIASLSLGIWSDFTIFDRTIFDSFDYLASNVMLPLSGLGISIFVGWVVKREVAKRQLEDYGANRFALFNVLIFLLRYVCPILLGLILLDSIGIL